MLELTRGAVDQIIKSSTPEHHILQVTAIKQFQNQKISQRLTLSDGVNHITAMLLSHMDKGLNLKTLDVI